MTSGENHSGTQNKRHRDIRALSIFTRDCLSSAFQDNAKKFSAQNKSSPQKMHLQGMILKLPKLPREWQEQKIAMPSAFQLMDIRGDFKQYQ